MADIIQACRSAWTACGLQSLLGDLMESRHPSLATAFFIRIATTTWTAKTSPPRRSSASVSDSATGCAARGPLLRTTVRPRFGSGRADRRSNTLARIIPRSLTACWQSIRPKRRVLRNLGAMANCSDAQMLRITCAKGGTSVLADACLAHGWLSERRADSRLMGCPASVGGRFAGCARRICGAVRPLSFTRAACRERRWMRW